jgi:glutathione S-transferase
MLKAMESAITDLAYVLGDSFSMADVIFGGTLRFMLAFKTIEARPSFAAYAVRLAQRPAL